MPLASIDASTAFPDAHTFIWKFDKISLPSTDGWDPSEKGLEKPFGKELHGESVKRMVGELEDMKDHLEDSIVKYRFLKTFMMLMKDVNHSLVAGRCQALLFDLDLLERLLKEASPLLDDALVLEGEFLTLGVYSRMFSDMWMASMTAPTSTEQKALHLLLRRCVRAFVSLEITREKGAAVFEARIMGLMELFIVHCRGMPEVDMIHDLCQALTGRAEMLVYDFANYRRGVALVLKMTDLNALLGESTGEIKIELLLDLLCGDKDLLVNSCHGNVNLESMKPLVTLLEALMTRPRWRTVLFERLETARATWSGHAAAWPDMNLLARISDRVKSMDPNSGAIALWSTLASFIEWIADDNALSHFVSDPEFLSLWLDSKYYDSGDALFCPSQFGFLRNVAQRYPSVFTKLVHYKSGLLPNHTFSLIEKIYRIALIGDRSLRSASERQKESARSLARMHGIAIASCEGTLELVKMCSILITEEKLLSTLCTVEQSNTVKARLCWHDFLGLISLNLLVSLSNRLESFEVDVMDGIAEYLNTSSTKLSQISIQCIFKILSKLYESLMESLELRCRLLEALLKMIRSISPPSWVPLILGEQTLLSCMEKDIITVYGSTRLMVQSMKYSDYTSIYLSDTSVLGILLCEVVTLLVSSLESNQDRNQIEEWLKKTFRTNDGNDISLLQGMCYPVCSQFPAKRMGSSHYASPSGIFYINSQAVELYDESYPGIKARDSFMRFLAKAREERRQKRDGDAPMPVLRRRQVPLEYVETEWNYLTELLLGSCLCGIWKNPQLCWDYWIPRVQLLREVIEQKIALTMLYGVQKNSKLVKQPLLVEFVSNIADAVTFGVLAKDDDLSLGPEMLVRLTDAIQADNVQQHLVLTGVDALIKSLLPEEEREIDNKHFSVDDTESWAKPLQKEEFSLDEAAVEFGGFPALKFGEIVPMGSDDAPRGAKNDDAFLFDANFFADNNEGINSFSFVDNPGDKLSEVILPKEETKRVFARPRRRHRNVKGRKSKQHKEKGGENYDFNF